jgi:protein-S-isoprenylcysteine O-methyltransferase Ste14
MLPLIYTNAIASSIFAVACFIWWVPEMIGTFKQRAKSRKEASVQDRGSLGILIGLQWLGLALSFWFASLFRAAAIQGPRTTLFVLGVIIILLGVALRWYAIWTLGRYFTRDVAVSADQQIVQNGPYHFIRHPAYSGTLLTMLGIGLAMTNWASLLTLLACVFLGHLYRIHVEEQAIVRAVGQPYVDYMHRTKRIIPLVF